jgi:hypothetical protein
VAVKAPVKFGPPHLYRVEWERQPSRLAFQYSILSRQPEQAPAKGNVPRPYLTPSAGEDSAKEQLGLYAQIGSPTKRGPPDAATYSYHRQKQSGWR